MKTVALLTCLISGALAHMHIGPIARAIISPATSNGATGYVKVMGGYLNISLDLTSFDYAGAGLPVNLCDATNSPGGISYHIHVKYPAGNPPVSGAGATCGGTNYGGHFDPWYACGGATDQKAACGTSTCSSCTGCIQRGMYACNPSNFMNDPFSCEVGDWSGKYGKLMEVSGTPNTFAATTAPNRYEITSTELYGTFRSVVFHCGANATRVLCAPFLPDVTTNATVGGPVTGIVAATTAGTRMVADFGMLPIRGPAIEFGGGELKMDAISVAKYAKFIAGCAGTQTSAVPIINAGYWNSTARGVDGLTAMAGECSGLALGGVLDPGVRCAPGSSMSTMGYCAYNMSAAPGMDNFRCPLGTPIPVNYTGDLMKSAYNAAQGTLVIPPTALAGVTAQGVTLPFPYLDETKLLGKSMSIVCTNNPAKGWCVKIKAMPANYVYQGRTMMPSKAPSASPVPGTSVSPTKSPVQPGKAAHVNTMTAMIVAMVATAAVTVAA